MITLRSSRLRVDIAQPGEAPNDTCRFDRAGFVEEIVLDGRHRFCASEPNNLPHPCSGGRGLCSEWKCDLSGEAAVGEEFPKLGIGLMRKPDEEPYVFYRRYDTRTFPIRVRQELPDRVEFTTEPLPCLHYAFEHVKTLTVRANVLTLSMRVRNVGEKRVRGQEYCHNFLSLDGMAVGPHYQVRFPQLADQGWLPMQGSFVCGDRRGFTFSRFSPEKVTIPISLEGRAPDGPFAWTLLNTDARVQVEGSDRLRLCHAQMFTADHMVAPATYHLLDLAPGEEDAWSRTYTFSTL